MDCDLMNEIATFTPHIILLFLIIIACLIAIPLIIYVCFKLYKNPLYHQNTRILLIAHGIALIIHLSDRIFLHGWDLIRWLIVLPSASSACEIISTTERCVFSRFPFNVGLWFCTCSSPAIVVERFLATRKISTYHQDNKSWIWLLFLQVCGTIYFLSLVYSKTVFGGQAYYCIAANTNEPINAIIACSTTIIIQVLSIFGYNYLVQQNTKLRDTLHKEGASLVKRYQVEESLRSLEILAPPYYAMFISQFTYAFLCVFLLVFGQFFRLSMFYFLLELALITPEYSIIFVFTFIHKQKSMNRKSLRVLKNRIEVKPETYFDLYKQSWNL